MNEPTIHEVTGCRTCPYSYRIPDDDNLACTATSHIKTCNLVNPLDQNEKPKFCPLLKHDIVVTMKK